MRRRQRKTNSKPKVIMDPVEQHRQQQIAEGRRRVAQEKTKIFVGVKDETCRA